MQKRDRMLSQLESLRKKLKGGDKASRKAYHAALTNYLNDLKTARKDRTNYIASSCREFGEGWEELPETRGFLESLLSKGGHKDVVKAVVYDPTTNDLKTCVDMDTFHAAKQWQQNTQGILDMQEDFSDLAVALPALLKSVNTLIDAASPFVVGSPTHPAKSVRGEDKEIVMVKGADGQQHPVNTCEASISEEECQSKTDTFGGEQACIWMPSQTAHVREQMKEWFAQEKGNAAIGTQALEALEAKVCVPKVEFPLPLRDATDVDIAALQLGKQLVRNEKQAMRSSGTMSQLRSASIGNVPIRANSPNAHYKDAYANARKSRKIGSRVFPTQVPYIREVRKDANGEAKIEFVEGKTTSAADVNSKASAIQRMFRNKRMMKNLPSKVQKKIEKVQAKMTALREKYKAELMSSDISANQIDKAAQIKLERDESYVSPADIRDYAIYQMVSATKGDGKPMLTESELHEILQSQHAGENYVRVSTSDADSSAWEGLLSNYSNYADDFKAIKDVVDKRNNDSKVIPKKSTWKSQSGGAKTASTLQQFLSAGGIPYEHPPANSEIGRRSFVMINEGSLSGGELAYGEWDKKSNNFKARRTKSMIVDEAEDKDVQESFGKDIVEYADTSTNLGNYQFILTPVELIVLKAIMKNNKQMIPWFRSFYSKKGKAQTGSTGGTAAKEADWVFANEDQDVKELAYLMANLPDSEETYNDNQSTVANFASALLRFPTEDQEATMMQFNMLDATDAAGQKQNATNSRNMAKAASYRFPLFFQDTKLLAELARHNAEGKVGGKTGKKLIHYLIGDNNDAQTFLSWRANLDGKERNYRAASKDNSGTRTGNAYNENEQDEAKRNAQQFPQVAALPKADAWKAVLAAGIKNPPVVYEVEVNSDVVAGTNTVSIKGVTVPQNLPADGTWVSWMANQAAPTRDIYGIIGHEDLGSVTSDGSGTLTVTTPKALTKGTKLRLGPKEAVEKWNAYEAAKKNDDNAAAFRDLRKIAELARAKYATRMGQQRFRKKSKNSKSMEHLRNL